MPNQINLKIIAQSYKFRNLIYSNDNLELCHLSSLLTVIFSCLKREPELP